MSPQTWATWGRREWLASLTSTFIPAGLGLGAWPLGAAAQPAEAWPARPLKMVVPFPPGGTTDLLGRAMGQELAKALGQPVTVENLPGAGGSIGAERAARAAPDGLTLLMGHIGTLAVNPALYANLPYDPEKSFTPVAAVARVPNVLVVPANLPYKTLAELLIFP
jgi:tripartite-type tricarboxylate transporter receptor subunit TctC